MAENDIPTGKAAYTNYLKDFRVKEGLTPSELAKLAEVSLRTLQKIENQGYRPKMEILHKIVIVVNERRRKRGETEIDFDEVFPLNQPLLF